MLQETDDRWQISSNSIWSRKHCLDISNSFPNEVKRCLQIKYQNADFRVAVSVLLSDITVYCWYRTLIKLYICSFLITIHQLLVPYYQFADPFKQYDIQILFIIAP
jgi:hypothetical protein